MQRTRWRCPLVLERLHAPCGRLQRTFQPRGRRVRDLQPRTQTTWSTRTEMTMMTLMGTHTSPTRSPNYSLGKPKCQRVLRMSTSLSPSLSLGARRWREARSAAVDCRAQIRHHPRRSGRHGATPHGPRRQGRTSRYPWRTGDHGLEAWCGGARPSPARQWVAWGSVGVGMGTGTGHSRRGRSLIRTLSMWASPNPRLSRQGRRGRHRRARRARRTRRCLGPAGGSDA